MVLVLGLADGIHISKSARRLLSLDADYHRAIAESVLSNFTPIALTSITTAIGFLTFNFSGYDGIVVMGNFVAFGVVMAFLLSISLLPALLCFCAIKAEPQKPQHTAQATLADLVIRYHRILLLLTVPAVLISIFCINLNEVDERVTRYLKKDYVFTRHLDAIQEALTGATSMIYNFNSGQDGGVSQPEFMAKVDAFAQWAGEQPEVRHVSSYTDTMKRLNQDLHAGDERYYRLPEDQQLAAQYLLLYEMSLPYGLDLTNQINLDKSGTRVVLTTDDLSLQRANSLIGRNAGWLMENAPELDSFANSNSLSTVLIAEEAIRITVLSGVVALMIIGLILLFTFRSFYAGLLCVISVTSPILGTYGIWGVSVGVINLPAGLAVCMVIGIAVDFSVHFVSKFVHATRQLKLPVEASVRYAFELVAAPIVTSTIVLGGGFGILVFSVFEYNSVMGALTALCILMSAASAFLLVPSILLTKTFSDL